MRRFRGLKSLVHDAVDRTAELIEEGHESTSRTVMAVLGAIEPIAEPARVVDGVRRVATAGVLGTIRAVNRGVQAVTDVALDAAEHRARMVHGEAALEPLPVPLRSDVTKDAAWIADAAIGLVNGAIGDHLHARGNGLDLGMALRAGDGYVGTDRPLDLPGATPRVAVFVHGLGTTEWSWFLEGLAYHGDAGASFGTLLARDLGYTPIYVRYNSGRHVSENGRLLAERLEQLVTTYPRAIEDLLLVGHSMGGLVLRSAGHYAREAQMSWPAKVRRVFCLGSPHHGAPLEKLGHLAAAVLGAIDTPGTRIPARILQGRSAGIKDLRHGFLVDDDWIGQDPDALREAGAREIPLLEHVAYHFVSATVTDDPEHPVGRLIGDLLVQVPSAHGTRCRHEKFPIDVRHHGGVLHHQLQNHPAVYAQLRAALERDPR